MNYLPTILAVVGLGLVAQVGAQPESQPVTDREALSRPISGLTAEEMRQFQQGRSLFQQSWVAAPAGHEEINGLGPLYNRLACISCHAKNGRGGAPDGPGQRMQSMLVRLSVAGHDAHGEPKPHPAYGEQLNEEGIPGVPGEGRASIQWVTSRVTLAGGERVELRRPRLTFDELAFGELGEVRMSPRVSPHVAGLGLLETVPATVLEKLARQVRSDGVRGKVNVVWDIEAQKRVVGRFGLKANTPTLRQQTAGAFVGDMGITSDLYPDENCTKPQTACRKAPTGGQPELVTTQLDSVEFYLAHLAPPPRRDADAPLVRQGEVIFVSNGCAACHLPTLPGGDHPKYPRLSGLPVAAYTDLLLHDMGPQLADGRPDYQANGRQWRTPPLWGLGLLAGINENTHYLHDGRARNAQEAILWHGGEAASARKRYAQLPRVERQALLAFLQSL
ncbi:c-type cytochrome [Rhodoferax sp. 4810]|nr:c-type cytochrome [Rhodoferax jenense]